MSKHGVFGCSNVVNAVVLQGMLADAGIYGQIKGRADGKYAIVVTHERQQENTVTAPNVVDMIAWRFNKAQTS